MIDQKIDQLAACKQLWRPVQASQVMLVFDASVLRAASRAWDARSYNSRIRAREQEVIAARTAVAPLEHRCTLEARLYAESIAACTAASLQAY